MKNLLLASAAVLTAVIYLFRKETSEEIRDRNDILKKLRKIKPYHVN
jgi:hypothetical protein